MKTSHNSLKFGAWGSSELSLSWGGSGEEEKDPLGPGQVLQGSKCFLSNKGGDSEMSL